MDQRGALSVLRKGFKYHGQQIRLAYFAPGHNLNPAVWDLYDQNRLRVVRQLRYDPKNDNALDLALFLNGLPIATAELQNPMPSSTLSTNVSAPTSMPRTWSTVSPNGSLATTTCGSQPRSTTRATLRSRFARPSTMR